MAQFNLALVGSNRTPSQPSSADRLYSIDGIQFWPPPEEARMNNNYRVSIQQVGTGQIADKGGPGGCQIEVSGIVGWKDAAWLRQLQNRILANASESGHLVFYDPISGVSYECLCKADSAVVNIVKPHLYQYSLTLWGQVLGTAWLDEPTVASSPTAAVQAFDLNALGWLIDEAEAAAKMATESDAMDFPAVATGSGTQPPTPPPDSVEAQQRAADVQNTDALRGLE